MQMAIRKRRQGERGARSTVGPRGRGGGSGPWVQSQGWLQELRGSQCLAIRAGRGTVTAPVFLQLPSVAQDRQDQLDFIQVTTTERGGPGRS